jgi:hypothetical protein
LNIDTDNNLSNGLNIDTDNNLSNGLNIDTDNNLSNGLNIDTDKQLCNDCTYGRSGPIILEMRNLKTRLKTTSTTQDLQ